MKVIHQATDKFFKQAMADIRVALDFFKSHLPADILAKLDLITLKLQKESFINEAYKFCEADVVYSVKWNQEKAYLYLLCEMQSEIDKNMPLRLHEYILNIIKYHHKQYPTKPLPIVYPIVIYAGEKPWTVPQNFFELFGTHCNFAKEVFLSPYLLVDVNRIDDANMRQYLWSGILEFVLKYRRVRDFAAFLETLFCWLEEIEICHGESLAKIVLKYVINDIEADDEKLLLEKANCYLSQALRGEIMTLAQRFEQRGIEIGEQRGIEIGEQRGIEIGKEQAARELALKMLKKGMSKEEISELMGISFEL